MGGRDRRGGKPHLEPRSAAAGGGQVLDPDRVRRPEAGRVGAAWTQAAPEVKGCSPAGGWDLVAAGGGIGRFSWAADAQYADV